MRNNNPFNCGPQKPWGSPGWKPRKHWFFFRVLFLFFWICLALVAVSLYSNGNFPYQRLLHYLGWIFLVMCVGFFILRRMFRPLGWLIFGVQEISNGNLDFQFPTGKRYGEIWYLAEIFNLMARRVKEMVDSKSRLLLDVSHELRSPLTRLKVALEMTSKSRLKTSMMQDIVEMETMLTEILETERLKGSHGQLSLAPINLSALAKEFTAKYKAHKPGVKVTGDSRNVRVQADEARLKTVFQNVLENALKYSANQKKPVEIRLEEGDGRTQVSFQDFGAGIPQEEQEKVFEPFYRVDKSRAKDTGGYGLGLSLCREIMQAHGGEISLESEPGKGTKVLLKFPKVNPI
ncbi:MAG TPA: HAMP domain-containing sensor histidine kinase [bacterium]